MVVQPTLKSEPAYAATQANKAVEILGLIPKEFDGERLEEALAHIRWCLGGGAATDNADISSDLEIVADNIFVSLRCPMSGSRMKIAGRFKPCAHMGCFDIEVFVEMNQRSCKMHSCGDDVTEIEVRLYGSWGAKSDDDRKSLGSLGTGIYPMASYVLRLKWSLRTKHISRKPNKENFFPVLGYELKVSSIISDLRNIFEWDYGVLLDTSYSGSS